MMTDAPERIWITPAETYWVDRGYWQGHEYSEGPQESYIRADLAPSPAVFQQMVEALEMAKQLTVIASDWNLDEVEINGEMRDIYDVRDAFDAALAAAKGDGG